MKTLKEMTNDELLEELREVWVDFVDEESARRYNHLECELRDRMNEGGKD